MSISKEEFESERLKLEDTRAWLQREINVLQDSNYRLKNRIAELKKQAKGGYNEELETAKKLYEITSKNYDNYANSYEQPYFARIDFREYRKDREQFYIGKFGLGDSSTGDEIVIDWRAPIADLYYSGTQGNAYYTAPVGIIEGELSLKRKFLFNHRDMKDAFDEGINEIILKSDEGIESELIDEYLKISLEQSISTKLKEVVATIQKEQNEIIRADKNQAVIVQGAAGSGKTTVALHRLAYLLYRYKHRMSGEEILVVAPNKIFLDYISEVLPNLGVDKVKQKTFDELASEFLEAKIKVLSRDKKLAEIFEANSTVEVEYVKSSSKVKGTLLYRAMMDRYIQIVEKDDINIDDIKVDEYTLFEKKEIKRLYTIDMAGLPINGRKDEIKRYLSLKLSEKIQNIIEKIDFRYEYQIARIKKTMEDGIDRRKKLIETYDERDSRKKDIKSRAKKEFDNYFLKWRSVDTKNLYYNIFKSDSTFEEVIAGQLSEPLARYIREEINSNEEKGILDSDDLAAVIYLKLRIEGTHGKYKLQHIVIDEAQDYSLFQLYVLKELTESSSFTIVGDIGQGIYYYKGINDWEKVISDVFNGEGAYLPLTQSYRSTVEIIQVANRILLQQKNELTPAVPVLRHGKVPQIIEINSSQAFAERVDNIVEEIMQAGKKSVAIIGKTRKECRSLKEILKKCSKYNWDMISDTDKTISLDKLIIPSYLTKGLEFDCSIIYNCNSDNYGDDELDKRLLYVVLTRALHFEYIFYQGELSPLLR